PTDQRSVVRFFGAAGDIGAYELAASAIRGQVTSANGPVTNAVVTADGASNDNPVTETAQTDINGFYAILGLPPGDYELSAAVDAFSFPAIDVTLGPDQTNQNFFGEAVYS